MDCTFHHNLHDVVMDKEDMLITFEEHIRELEKVWT